MSSRITSGCSRCRCTRSAFTSWGSWNTTGCSCVSLRHCHNFWPGWRGGRRASSTSPQAASPPGRSAALGKSQMARSGSCSAWLASRGISARWLLPCRSPVSCRLVLRALRNWARLKFNHLVERSSARSSLPTCFSSSSLRSRLPSNSSSSRARVMRRSSS